MSGVAVQQTAQAVALEGSGSAASDGVLAKQVDSLYDGTLNNPPKKGWSDSQLDIKAEIESLESRQSNSIASVCDQLRLAELKLDFVESVAATKQPPEAGKFISALCSRLSSNLNALSGELNQIFATSNTDLTVTEVNALIGKLEAEGISVPGSSASAAELDNRIIASNVCSLVVLRESLTTTPTRTMEATFRNSAHLEMEKANSLAEGSQKKFDCQKKADYLVSAADKLKNSESLLGNSEEANFEQLTFNELKAVDPESLKAESDVFKQLSKTREAQLKPTLLAAGTAEADIPAAIKADPLLQYYDARSDLAEKRGGQLADVGLDTASGQVRSIGIAFSYATEVAKSDQVYYYAMSQEAAKNGDAQSKAKFDTMASEAGDKIGVLSKGAQTLIGMMTGVVEKAMSSA